MICRMYNMYHVLIHLTCSTKNHVFSWPVATILMQMQPCNFCREMPVKRTPRHF